MAPGLTFLWDSSDSDPNFAHELLTSHAYFTLGRPHDFRLAARLNAADALRVGSCRPDAVFTDSDTGELVVVEADSGHYSQQ